MIHTDGTPTIANAPRVEPDRSEGPPMIHWIDVGATRARGYLVAMCGYKARGTVEDNQPVDCVVCLELGGPNE